MQMNIALTDENRVVLDLLLEFGFHKHELKAQDLFDIVRHVEEDVTAKEGEDFAKNITARPVIIKAVSNGYLIEIERAAPKAQGVLASKQSWYVRSVKKVSDTQVLHAMLEAMARGSYFSSTGD